jgi:RNA polymerase-binding protein DksA
VAKSTPKKTAKATKSRQPAREAIGESSRKSRAKTAKTAPKRALRGVKSTTKVRTPVRPGGSNGSVPPKVTKDNMEKPVTANTGGNQPAKTPAGKNPAGLKAKDLAFFRDLLLAKRRELVGDVHSMEQEALQTTSGGANLSNLPIHMADMGTDNYEQEFTLGLVEKDRQLLREINAALQKIRDGNYGICEGTGKPIARARLEAQPWARYSIEYARHMEKGKRPPTMQLPED